MFKFLGFDDLCRDWVWSMRLLSACGHVVLLADLKDPLSHDV